MPRKLRSFGRWKAETPTIWAPCARPSAPVARLTCSTSNNYPHIPIDWGAWGRSSTRGRPVAGAAAPRTAPSSAGSATARQRAGEATGARPAAARGGAPFARNGFFIVWKGSSCRPVPEMSRRKQPHRARCRGRIHVGLRLRASTMNSRAIT